MELNLKTKHNKNTQIRKQKHPRHQIHAWVMFQVYLMFFFLIFHCIIIVFHNTGKKKKIFICRFHDLFFQMLVLWLIHKDTGIKSVTGVPQIKNTIPGHLVGSTLVVVSLHKPRLTICAACGANISTSRSLGHQDHLDDTRRKEGQSCVQWRRFGSFILFRKHFKPWPFGVQLVFVLLV